MDNPDIIFGTVFGQSELNFRNGFRTVRTKFLRIFLDSPDRIFGQSGTNFRDVCVLFLLRVIAKNLNNMLVVIPGLRFLGFVLCFDITVIW